MLLLTTGFVLYLLIKPPVLSFLGKHIFWFPNRDMEHIRQDLGQVEQHSENGYLKITFYFYQAAELLIVGSAENLLHKIPIVYAVVAAFNFKVRSITNGIGCPFPGITAVTKELLLSATVLITMAEVAILFCAHFIFNIIRQKERPSLLHYMAVALEVLLLGYERLAETSLKLMHCVPIGSEKRFVFQWRDYLLAVVAVYPAGLYRNIRYSFRHCPLFWFFQALQGIHFFKRVSGNLHTSIATSYVLVDKEDT